VWIFIREIKVFHQTNLRSTVLIAFHRNFLNGRAAEQVPFTMLPSVKGAQLNHVV
jgi:hypothetical protein